MDTFLKNLNLECFSNSVKYPGGCGWPQVAILAENILQVLIIVGLFAAGCMVAYAGWLLFAKGGSDEARSKAKKIFKNIILGVILLLGAYFIVDLILTKVGVVPEFREGFVEPSGTQ